MVSALPKHPKIWIKFGLKFGPSTCRIWSEGRGGTEHLTRLLECKAHQLKINLDQLKG